MGTVEPPDLVNYSFHITKLRLNIRGKFILFSSKIASLVVRTEHIFIKGNRKITIWE